MEINQDILLENIKAIIEENSIGSLTPSIIRQKIEAKLEFVDGALSSQEHIIEDKLVKVLEEMDQKEVIQKKRKVKSEQKSTKKAKTEEEASVYKVSKAERSLKKMIKAMGLGPGAYRGTKEMDEDERIETYSMRIRNAGGAFKGKYPNNFEINDAKIRKERDDCLEGIDLSNIIKSKLRKTTKVEAPVKHDYKEGIHEEYEFSD